MPTLPGVLAPVRAAVASLLLSSCHANHLYSADDIVIILNSTVNVADGSRVDATLLLRAFANEAADSFILDIATIGTRQGQHPDPALLPHPLDSESVAA